MKDEVLSHLNLDSKFALIVETQMSHVMRKPVFFAHAKTKMQSSFAVTTKLISAFVFANRIVQSLYYLHLKF